MTNNNIKKDNYLKVIKRFSASLPKFPDGRIDYSDSDAAPVLTVFVKYRNKILLLKRSDKVRVYQGLWNTVAVYLDEDKPLSDKIRVELMEELNIRPTDIDRINPGRPFELVDETINKTWLIFPAMAVLKRNPEIKLDWEHIGCRWIEPEMLTDYNIVPKLEQNWKNANAGLA